MHGGIANDVKVRIVYIDSEELEDEGYHGELATRGRHPGRPGLRLARRRREDARDPLRAREAASRSSASASACSARRSSSRATWCGMVGANSTEFDDESPYKVIYKLRDLIGVDALGGTMRLGKYPCALKEGSIARAGVRRGADRRAPPPPLRGQSRVRAAARGARLPRDRPLARRQVRRDHRARRPPVVPRLPVPSRVQVAPDRAAPALPLVHRRRARATRRRRKRPWRCAAQETEFV